MTIKIKTMERDFTQEEKYISAKRRVEELKKYYWHLIIYVVVNIFISVNNSINYMDGGESFTQALTHFSVYAIWIFWGIGIAFHTLRVFGFNLFFGKDWEERKIREFMD